MASPSKNVECVKVIVRCRPLSSGEIKDGHKRVVQANSVERQIQINSVSASEPAREFTFDQVYDWDSRQQDIYNESARPIVDAVLNGYNGTIFAYGQTGCGKTFTMEGKEEPAELRGIIPQAFDHIFTEIAKGEHRQYLVRATYLEIYQEEVRDLLSKNPNQRLEVKESADKGVYVKGLVQFVVKSVAEINSVLQVGRKNRSVASTLMNQDSSRSHSVFAITVETADKADSSAASGDAGGPAGIGNNTVRVGKLNLVDLAGSERQSKTGATGDRLKEATKINLSLSALGNVISALVDGRPGGHIPYRDSKLTRLLQDSLGGNTKTVMVANIGPAGYNYEETLSTLRYANRAKNIANKPHINEDPKDAMLREFQGEIERLKAQLLSKERAPAPRIVEQVVEKDAAPETVAAVRESLRQELAQRMKKAASAQALAQARAQAEAHAHSQLEALLAQKAADEEERQRAREALQQQETELARYADGEFTEEQLNTCAGEEERQRAHEALQQQEAELARYAEQVAAQRQEAEALQAKIKAMEDKVLDGGQNLLEVVDKLTAETAAQEAALQAEKAAEAAALSRIAELEQANLHIEEQYNSVQEEVEQKQRKLQKLQSSYQSKRAEAADLQSSFQREREDLLQDIYILTRQIKLKDLLIASYIPPHHQQRIMQHCSWDDMQQSWEIEHLHLAGNAVKAQQQKDRQASGNDASTAQPIQDAASSQQQNAYLTYKPAKASSTASSISNIRPNSVRRPIGSASKRPGSSMQRPHSSRHSSRAPCRGGDPTDIGSLTDQVARLDVDKSKMDKLAFPSARGLLSAGRRPPSRGLNV